jgi:hypothetical protein
LQSTNFSRPLLGGFPLPGHFRGGRVGWDYCRELYADITILFVVSYGCFII